MIITGIPLLRLKTRPVDDQRYISAWISLWSSEKVERIEDIPSRYPNLVRVDPRTFEFPIFGANLVVTASVFLSLIHI